MVGVGVGVVHGGEDAVAVEEATELRKQATRQKPGCERAGRGRNHMQPHTEAIGPHSTFRRTPEGHVSNHAQWQPSARNPSGFDEVKRVDVMGEPHKNKVSGELVASPHVHDKAVPGSVRPAQADEIPARNRSHR